MQNFCIQNERIKEMTKLALSDEILMKIDKPARYIGNELNSVCKNKDEVSIRFAMCFPDVYEIGMSHLGIQILYDMFNKRDDVWCERVYSRRIMQDHEGGEHPAVLPGITGMSEVNVSFGGITISMRCVTINILQILDLEKADSAACRRP